MKLEDAYDRFAGPLYRHALALTRNDEDAEDAVQTVFVKLAGRLRRSRARIDDLGAYLHGAVRNEALRLLSRRPAPGGELSLVEAKNGMAPEEVDGINHALGKLPAEQREVVLLHVYEGMTFRKIGEMLGVPPDTAASRYRYAKEKLEDWLRDD